MAQDKDTKELARKIRARKKFLKRIVTPVINLVVKRGRVLERHMGSCNIHIISELRNFGGFTFETDLGQTQFGGSTVTIFYHPHCNFREGGIDFARENERIVLSVFFQTEAEYEYKVITFDNRTDWQRVLIHVLQNADKIAERQNAKEKRIAERNKAESELAEFRKERKLKLIEEAKNLSIIPKS